MASARKKQDEKHLKILRELVSLQGNKQCFDCHQRGPTYVNMTIGSFVCTSCSGMLRGLTPPHRVKSISMASFTPEEIELIKSRGNEFCKRVWLGLYDPSHEQEAKDEQQIKDFMVAKYEKRRYYLDPSQAGVISAKNGTTSPPPASPALSQSSTRVSSSGLRETKPLSSLVGPGVRSIVLGHHPTSSSTDNIHIASSDFSKMSSSTAATWLRDFAKDPFSSSSPSLVATGNTPNASSSSSLQQPSFANFDNNPIFTSPTFQSSVSVNCDTVHPRYNTNRWSMPTPAALSSLGNAMMPLQGGISGAMSGSANQPPSEDRYAALKDLDSLMKSSGGVGGGSMSSLENGGTHSDWNLGTGSASPWAPQPTNPSTFGGGTVFGSPSSSTLSSNASQNLFPASPPMEASAVPIVSANGTPGFAAGASFTSPSSNPFTGASLAVDPNSPWVPSSVASSGSPAVPLNPFQTTRTSFDNSNNQVTWAGVGTAGMGMLANGQHPGVGANGSQTFQSNQPFGMFSGSPLNSTVLPQYPAAKVWPPAGNPFLAGSRPTPQTHSSNPFL